MPFPRVPVTFEWIIGQMTRTRVERAYLGSLNRRVRDAACARLGVLNRFLAPFFTGARRFFPLLRCRWATQENRDPVKKEQKNG